jgi:NADH-quinone oxidoreductase subunit G
MHVDQRVQTIQRTMSVPEDDAISDGWLCDRGRYNVGYVTDGGRLTSPLYKQDGQWMQIAWDDAIALWANAVRDAIASDGAASVGAIGGGRLLNEEALLLAHIHRTLGVANRDWRAGRMVRAWPGPLPIRGNHVELETSTVIITYGEPPAQTAPVLDLRIRKAVAHHGAMLISVGDHLASTVLPCTRVATFAEVQALIPAGPQRIAIVWDGIAVAEAHAAAAFAGSLPEGSTFRFYAPGEQPNAFGAEALGMLPGDGGLDTRGMFEAARDGKLRVLALLGVNPVLHFPDRDLATAALDATPFVVVSELFMTETAERATLVLPACSAFEKSGTTTNLAGDVLPVSAGVPAPESALADGDMLVALAEALGVTLPAPDALDAQVRELVAGTPNNPALPAPDDAPRAIASAETLRVVIGTTIFTGGGTLAHDERLAHLRTAPTATVHPATAKRLDLLENDEIDIAGPERAQLDGLRVVFDDRVAEGVVHVIDGLPGAPVNALRGAVSVMIAAKRRTERVEVSA